MKNNTIQTERLILRPWVEADIEPFADMCADPRVMEFFGEKLSYEEAATWLDFTHKCLRENGFTLWAVEIPSVTSFAGFTGLSRPGYETPFTPCVEVGWRLAYRYWGKGYASEAAKASIKHGFEECKLDEIVSFTTLSNKRSQSVMKRVGMKYNDEDDFLHPKLDKGHPLIQHVLYRLTKSDWLKQTER